MEATNQAQTKRRVDGARGVKSEEHGGEVGGVSLEDVLAVENGETFGMCALGGEEDVGGKIHRCRLRGPQLVGVPGYDGCLVREE